MRSLGRTQGFTLVEVLAAIVAGSLLILSVGIMLKYGYLGWIRNSTNVEMQCEGATVMRTVSRYVREAQDSGITATTGTLTIVPTNSTGTKQFSLTSSSNLVFDSNTAVSGNDMILIKGRATSFITRKINGVVQVVLTIRQDTENVSFTNSVYFRN